MTALDPSTDDHRADANRAEATWQEIDAFLAEIAELSRQPELAEDTFYTRLLDRLVVLIAAHAGAVWLRQPNGNFRLVHQVRYMHTGLERDLEAQRAHLGLLERSLADEEVVVVPPNAGAVMSGGTGNPTPFTLMMVAVCVDGAPCGMVEVFLPPDAGPGVGRGCAELLAAISDLAADFQRQQQRHRLQSREALWQQIDRFVTRVYGSLHVHETAFAITNEGRVVIDCDRVSVLMRRGNRQRLLAISGVDHFDRRSDAVRRLVRLAQSWSAADEPFWYDGQADQLPAALAALVDQQVDQGDLRQLALVPLCEDSAVGHAGDRPALGMLVVESFRAGDEAGIRQRTAIVARHAALALQRARQYSDLPLAGVLNWWAGWLSFLRLRHLPKTIAVLLLLIAAVAALAIVPADFDIEVRGELQPEIRRDIFAPSNGVVVDCRVRHGDSVAPGDLLAVLRNPDLDLEQQRIEGELQTARQRLAALEAMRLEEESVGDRGSRGGQLVAEAQEVQARLASLAVQKSILAKQRDELSVRSPIAGQVITWDVEQLLRARPLSRGQRMMRIADFEGPWTAELWLPEDQTEHVQAAARASNQPLPVSFILKADPQTVHRGRVERIALAAEPHPTEGRVVLVLVGWDGRQIAQPTAGAGVIAHIHCGRRPIGYVWFHDLLDAVRAYILF